MRPADPKLWRAISSIALVVFIVSLVIESSVPSWGWWALIVSGVAFAVELVLSRRASR
ncbi:MAG TPA: hypothetical protein VIL49_08300 [Capillimicrobium sp.]|jgi:hypothetical protein